MPDFNLIRHELAKLNHLPPWYHTGNRLFIVLHDQTQPEQTWKPRRDFEALETLIQDFLGTPTLLGLTITNQHTQQIYQPWAVVIFYIK